MVTKLQHKQEGQLPQS